MLLTHLACCIACSPQEGYYNEAYKFGEPEDNVKTVRRLGATTRECVKLEQIVCLFTGCFYSAVLPNPAEWKEGERESERESESCPRCHLRVCVPAGAIPGRYPGCVRWKTAAVEHKHKRKRACGRSAPGAGVLAVLLLGALF